MTAPTDQPSRLFRDEVFDAKRDTWLGQIVLIRPISFTFLTIGTVALAATVLAFLFLGEYTRKAKVSGYVVPSQGLIKIVAQQNGVIAELRVKEGQLVEQGEVLAVLNSERATATGGVQAGFGKQIAVRHDSLLADREKIDTLYAQQTRALNDRVNSQRAELAQVESGIKLQQERIRISEQMLDKQRRLNADKFISDLALQQKEQEGLSELAALENLKRSRTSILRDIGAIASDLKSLPVKRENEISALERNLATLEQDRIENESRREIQLVAPQSGIVTGINADPGKLAVAGQPLLNILPQGSGLQADVYVPSRAAGFIRAGSKALLQYQAYPYQKFGSHEGKISKISRTAVASNELPFPAAQGELFYVATIELAKQTVTAYGKEERLQSGMLVDCSILLDRRTIFEWVFEPLYSISGRWGA